MSLGPLIRRSARYGGALLSVAPLQFVAAMVLAQLAYPGYSDWSNVVSDLGGGRSPRALLFNGSLVVLGLLAIGGIYLARSAFRKGVTARGGIGLYALASLGALGVGLFPIGKPLHSDFAGLAFVTGGAALLLLALGMLRDTRWDGYRLFTLLGGLVTFVGLALFDGPTTLGLGLGGAERLIIAPGLLWSFLAGVHLLRLPVYGGPRACVGDGSAGTT
ncbi:MAG TPA: DUF998 domain-containing protein [Thermoplasmata archaeon]|nr:DUF998 domain-containing protein [Thermoplasmata archaeon]